MTPDEIEDFKKMWEHAETIYLPQEDYDKLVERLNQPSDPKTIQSLKKLLERKAPWDEHNN